MDLDLVVALSIVTGMGFMGIGSLFLRDYCQRCRRLGLPYLPNALTPPVWLRRLTGGFFLVFIFWVCLKFLLYNGLWGCSLVAAVFFWAHFRYGLGRVKCERAAIMKEIAEAIRQKLPLSDFIRTLSMEHRGPVAGQLQAMAMGLDAGKSLSEVSAGIQFFPPHSLAEIKAVESGGGAALANILQSSAEEWSSGLKTRSRMVASMAYPMASWGVCLPLAALLAYNRWTLPHFFYWPMWLNSPDGSWWKAWLGLASAMVLVSAGALFLLVFTWLWGEGRGGPVILQPLWNVGPTAGMWLERHLPIFRARWHHRSLARAARTLSALAEAGVPLHKAFQQVASPELAGPHAAAFGRLANSSEQGAPLIESLKNSKLPRSFVCLALAGAAGGVFAQAMRTVCEWHELKAFHLEERLIALLPCIATPIAGAMVGSFYISTLWANSELVTILRGHP